MFANEEVFLCIERKCGKKKETIENKSKIMMILVMIMKEVST
jgi:hypothetical protein